MVEVVNEIEVEVVNEVVNEVEVEVVNEIELEIEEVTEEATIVPTEVEVVETNVITNTATRVQ